MITFSDFTRQAPHVAEVFLRRHRAAHNLCLLATTRADGSPRISPMEPRVLDDHLVVVGMEGTTKFRDLARDPRFCLHTATVDPQVGDGDAKLFGRVHHLDRRAAGDSAAGRREVPQRTDERPEPDRRPRLVAGACLGDRG